MWIEQRKLIIAPLEMHPKGHEFIIQSGSKKFSISKGQLEYLHHFQKGESIHTLVKELIRKGWLVSFREIFHLLENLVNHNLILNPEIVSYFSMAKGHPSSTGISELSHYKGHVVANPESVKSLPFFRTLHPDLQKVFIKNATVKTLPGSTRICKTGEHSRELFAILEGSAGVYRCFSDGKRQLLSVVPQGALFGEGGFLLDRPRGADVITLQETTLAVISYSEEFGIMINSGKAEHLQQRFWVLQGLLTSELFSHIPSETLDSLVFAGKVKSVKENEIITREGDLGKSFYIIIQGSVAFTQHGKSLRALGQGEVFGEVALMVSGGTRTATAQAQRDCLLLEISMEEFYELLSNHLILAKEIEEVAWNRWQNRIQNNPIKAIKG